MRADVLRFVSVNPLMHLHAALFFSHAIPSVCALRHDALVTRQTTTATAATLIPYNFGGGMQKLSSHCVASSARDMRNKSMRQ